MTKSAARPGQRQAITSLQNDRVKAIRALEMRKERRDSGLFVAEGAAILVSARARGHLPQTLVAGPGADDNAISRDLIRDTLAGGGDVLDVSAAILEKLAAKDNPQTVLGVYRQVWAEPPEPTTAAASPQAPWLLLEAIRDPGNLGTIIRTADATGIGGIILGGTCCDPFAREAVRATMGSIFAVPLVRLEASKLGAFVKAWPGDSVATHLDAREDYRNAALHAPALIVMGSEGPGLSDGLADACTRRVKIPMRPGIDSLNLAIATALMLYQVQATELSV
jgi:RNA methyltransferase, TrmH family